MPNSSGGSSDATETEESTGGGSARDDSGSTGGGSGRDDSGSSSSGSGSSGGGSARDDSGSTGGGSARDDSGSTGGGSGRDDSGSSGSGSSSSASADDVTSSSDASLKNKYGSITFKAIDVDFGEDAITTYLEPGSDKPGDANKKSISGKGTVTEIGYKDGVEYWKVTQTSDDGSVFSTWVNSGDFDTKEAIGDDDEYYRYSTYNMSQAAWDAREEAAKADQAAAEAARAQEMREFTDSSIPDYGNGVGVQGNSDYELWLYSPSSEVGALSMYAYRLTKIFGMPPQWSKFVDPKMNFGSAIIGRRYSETIMASPTVLSLCPGMLKYDEGLSDLSAMSDADMLDALTAGTFEPFWQFKEFWHSDLTEGGGYVNFCNILCRYAAICLSVNTDGSTNGGEEALSSKRPPFGSSTYAQMDVDDFLEPNDKNNNTLFGEGGLGNLLQRFVRNFTELNLHYVHFNANGQLSVGESFSTETRATVIENMVNGAIDNTVKDIAFLTNGVVGSDVSSDLSTFGELAVSSLGGPIGSLISAATEVLQGGTIAFPQVIDKCEWGRSFQFTVKFISIYGDVESRFLNVIMPYICLACFWLPKQLKHKVDMYTYPPVVRAFARGVYACDCGVVTDVSVKRGGEDDNAWTASGQPMEIDVSFTVKALHQSLMQSDSPVWFAKNVGLQLYIGTLCGIDMTLPQADLIKLTIEAFTKGFFMDIGRNISYGLYKAIYNNPINKLARGIVNMGS